MFLGSAVLFTVGLFFLRKKKLPVLVVILWLGAGAGVTGAILGWFHLGVGWVTGLLSGIIAGATALVIIAVWLLLTVGHDLHPKHKGAANRQTAIAALLLPLLLTMLPGPVSEFVLSVGNHINAASAALIDKAF